MIIIVSVGKRQPFTFSTAVTCLFGCAISFADQGNVGNAGQATSHRHGNLIDAVNFVTESLVIFLQGSNTQEIKKNEAQLLKCYS